MVSVKIDPNIGACNACRQYDTPGMTLVLGNAKLHNTMSVTICNSCCVQMLGQLPFMQDHITAAREEGRAAGYGEGEEYPGDWRIADAIRALVQKDNK